jgi:hypothetical protein
MTDPAIGQLIDGRYEVEAVIGRGGMGTVVRARHRFTGVQVALKVLRDDLGAAADLEQRFLAEARAASVIGHPAIVVVNDANRTPTGQLYLAMELLVGRPLRVAMIQGLNGGDVQRIALELLDALAAAHARGFVHRDLKPENIFLLATTGAVKVLDFGIAKVLGLTDGRTGRGMVLGTLEYMAPEQLVDASTVDARADLWAVGIVLYEMITGLRPFPGATQDERYHALLSNEPVPIGDVMSTTPELSAFFVRALARDPAHRFQTALEMSAVLRSLVLTSQQRLETAPGSPTLGTGAAWAKPVGSGERASPHRRRWRFVVAAIGISIVGGGIAIAVVASKGSRSAATDAGIVRVVDGGGDRCTIACERLDKCNVAQSSCHADCEHKQILLDCVEPATTCDQLAACTWAWTCGGPATGTKSCNESLTCLTNCGMDGRCRCGCIHQMKPSSATLMARLYTCRTEVASDNDLFLKNCSGYANRCFADVP